MSTSERTPLFILGVGFIGGSLLSSLLASDKYTITALVRGEDKAEKLKSLGVTPLLGSLSDGDLIAKTTTANDIIIHTATADDQPSVAAILKGLEQRPKDRKPAVYIHTSGTGLLVDEGKSLAPAKIVYSDKKPADIDALPDSAPHRDVDLLIKNAIEGGKVGSAKIGIILPPVIYGVGTGPFNNTSIQIPGWIRRSIKDKFVSVGGEGKAEWNHIHIANLVPAYETLLKSLVSTSGPHPLYYFAETGHHTWLSIAETIRDVLVAKGLVAPDLKLNAPGDQLSTNSRSSAQLLRELGWTPTEQLSVWDSVKVEVEEILGSQ